MANSKSKGSKNERELCKWFTEWSGLEFSRVPASGGLRWKKTDNISGDIVCSDPRGSRRFPFTVEAKFYKDINFEHLILGNKSVKILQFWDQAKEDALRAKKEPILFMRYNGMPKRVWFVVMHEELFEKLNYSGITNYHFNIHKPGQESLIAINSNDLLKTNYKVLSRMVKMDNRKNYK